MTEIKKICPHCEKIIVINLEESSINEQIERWIERLKLENHTPDDEDQHE